MSTKYLIKVGLEMWSQQKWMFSDVLLVDQDNLEPVISVWKLNVYKRILLR